MVAVGGEMACGRPAPEAAPGAWGEGERGLAGACSVEELDDKTWLSKKLALRAIRKEGLCS